jgi:hypothetical protein
MERYRIRTTIKKRENKPAKTTKTNFQSIGDIKKREDRPAKKTTKTNFQGNVDIEHTRIFQKKIGRYGFIANSII